MGNARTRTTFRSLCFVAFASASSSVFWSSAPRPVVREEAPRQKSRSSFQAIERRVDEKVTPPVTEAPVTEAPVTEALVTEALVTEAPVTELKEKEHQRRQSSFQEVERRIDEKDSTPTATSEECHKKLCWMGRGDQESTWHKYKKTGETIYRDWTSCQDLGPKPAEAPSGCDPSGIEDEDIVNDPPSTTTSELGGKENQKKLKLFVDKPLGDDAAAETTGEEKLDEMPNFQFGKAERVLKGLQKRLKIINDASNENQEDIVAHRKLIKERRDDFAKFVKKLNDELAILRNGMKCINQGAQIIANIASRPSFLEIQSGAFIDRGTVLDGGCGGGEVGGAGSTAGAVDWTENGADGKGDKEAETQCVGKQRGISGMCRADSNAECHRRGGCTFETGVNRPGCEGKQCAVCNSVENCQNDENCEMVNLSDLPESIPMCKPKCLKDSETQECRTCSYPEQKCCDQEDEDFCKTFCEEQTNYGKGSKEYVECIKPFTP